MFAALGVFFFSICGWFFKDFFFKSQHSNLKQEELLRSSFFTLPPLIINLKSLENKRHMLKVIFVIESTRLEDKETITHLQPVILDQFQTYLRELTVQDLQGAVGLERIRQELLSRTITLTKSLGVQVRNILFKEFLIS